MALSTVATFLMHKVSSSMEKLVCIKDYPDLGGTPSALETTTLCDHAQTYIAGLKSGEQMEFTANYTAEDYAKVLALAGAEKDLAIYFGEGGTPVAPDGHDGIFSFKGYVDVRISGKGVDEVREMVIVVTPSTEISFSVPSADPEPNGN